MRSTFSLLLIMLLISIGVTAQSKKYSEQLILMGSSFEIAVVSSDSALAHACILKAIEEIERIENLISSHKQTSETVSVISQAGIKPVKVSKELFELVRRSIKISHLTDGAFDISYAVMDDIWDFKTGESKVPSPTEITERKALINYKNIVLSEQDTTIFLRTKRMKIGFGALGKGYAANRAKAVLVNLGMESGFVNASGDILFWGSSAGGEPWRVGIASPENRQNSLGWLDVNNVAVVTSGNYESFIETDSTRYSHILDPATGWPASGTKSVTVVCADAELADAMATSVSVLGVEQGLALINQLKGLECLIIAEDGQIYTSLNMELRGRVR